MTTSPSGLIRGVTPRIRPTFSSVMLLTWPVWLIDGAGDARHALARPG